MDVCHVVLHDTGDEAMSVSFVTFYFPKRPVSFVLTTAVFIL